MTIEQISFRDFTRGEMPADILLLQDKKTKKNKGLYISPKYVDEVLDLISKKEKQRANEKKRALLDYIDAFGNDQELSGATHQEIKAKKYE